MKLGSIGFLNVVFAHAHCTSQLETKPARLAKDILNDIALYLHKLSLGEMMPEPAEVVAGNSYQREDRIRNLVCADERAMGCEREIPKEEFRMWPMLTQKEYTLSGWCRQCQDKVFDHEMIICDLINCNHEGEIGCICTCDSPCCEVDVGVGILTCESQHCRIHGYNEVS